MASFPGKSRARSPRKLQSGPGRSGGSPSKRPRILSPSPPSSPTSSSAPPKSALARDTVAAVLALSDDPKIESMRAHGDVNRMDAEVALVLVDKLSSWLSLPEASSYLDSHPNVARKIRQRLATLPSPPHDTSRPDPPTSRTAPAAQHGGEPSSAPPAPIPLPLLVPVPPCAQPPGACSLSLSTYNSTSSTLQASKLALQALIPSGSPL